MRRLSLTALAVLMIVAPGPHAWMNICWDLEDIELHKALEILSKVSGVKIALAVDVNPNMKLTLNERDASYEQAFEAILAESGLTWQPAGEFIVVVKSD